MTLGPVVSSSGLTEDEVIRAEELSERSGSDRVHGSGLEIHQNGSGNVTSASGLIEVDLNSFQLEIRLSVVGAGRVDSVFVGNDFPELGTDLVTALTSLDMDDFSHGYVYKFRLAFISTSI